MKLAFNHELRDVDILYFCTEAFMNFPDYAENFQCIDWDDEYESGIFVFEDLNDFDKDGKVKTFKVDIKDVAKKGFPAFFKRIAEKELHLEGFNLDTLMGIRTERGMDNALGSLDAVGLDALLQCTIFGEVIYG